MCCGIYQASSILLGDARRKGYYETTTNANSTAYTGSASVAVTKDLRKSSISLGKAAGEYVSTAQRAFTEKGNVAYTAKQVDKSVSCSLGCFPFHTSMAVIYAYAS